MEIYQCICLVLILLKIMLAHDIFKEYYICFVDSDLFHGYKKLSVVNALRLPKKKMSFDLSVILNHVSLFCFLQINDMFFIYILLSDCI